MMRPLLIKISGHAAMKELMRNNGYLGLPHRIPLTFSAEQVMKVSFQASASKRI